MSTKGGKRVAGGGKREIEASEAVLGGRPQRQTGKIVQTAGEGVAFADPHMQELLTRHGPAPFYPHPVETEPAYRTLVSSIVGQQLSSKAAQTIWNRLEARFPVEPAALYRADPAELLAIGLSGAKAAYVRDLSRFALEGGLEGIEGQPDGLVVAHLTRVKGIGVWSAQMFLMFGLRRPDVWPVLDLGIRKGAGRLYGVSGKAELEALGERFRPYRSHAAWYLWRVLE